MSVSFISQVQWVESIVEVDQIKVSRDSGRARLFKPPANCSNTQITLLSFVILFVHMKAYLAAESSPVMQVWLSLSAGEEFGWMPERCRSGDDAPL